MNSITVVPESSRIAPEGVFYGSVFGSLGKAQVSGLHGHSDFGVVALSLFNTAIEFLAKQTKAEVELATMGSIASRPVSTGNGGLSADVVIAHPSWNGQEYSMQGYIDPLSPGNSAKGDIAHFERLMELVLDKKGQSVLATARKRAGFYLSVRLGFHQV